MAEIYYFFILVRLNFGGGFCNGTTINNSYFSKIYEAFEFDDDNDAGPTAALRKTPASGGKSKYHHK